MGDDRIIKGNNDVITNDNLTEKAHDLVDVDYFPDSVIKLQTELLHPYHNGLYIRLITQFEEEFKDIKNPADFLTLLCTAMEVKLDGEYTMEELSKIVYDKLETERRLNSL